MVYTKVAEVVRIRGLFCDDVNTPINISIGVLNGLDVTSNRKRRIEVTLRILS